MKKIYVTGALLLLVVLGIAAWTLYESESGNAESPFGSLDEARLKQGNALFLDNCASCHGRKARGGIYPLVSQEKQFMAPALNGSAHTWHHSPRQLSIYIKSGSPDPKSPMTGFSDRLSDDDIQQILAYLYSLWPEKIHKAYRRHKS